MALERLALLGVAFAQGGIALGAWAVRDTVVPGVDILAAFAHNQQEHRDTVLALAASGYLVAYVLVFPPIKQSKLVKRNNYFTLIG